jgi:hypothetical protein
LHLRSVRYKLFLTSFTTAWYFTRSHDLNLTNRLGLWSGSLGVSAPCGPFAFYHASEVVL